MYLIFNKFGHCEMTAYEASALSGGQYCLEAEWDDDRPFAWSDGVEVWFSDVPPPSHLYQLRNGEWVMPDSVAAQQLASVRSDKLKQLKAAAQACIDQAAGLDKVPEFEVATWAIQAFEAKAWKADENTDTPTLNAIAEARGIPAEVLKKKAFQKAVQYELLTAHVAGLRQAAEDKIKAAETVDDVLAVTCDFCNVLRELAERGG